MHFEIIARDNLKFFQVFSLWGDRAVSSTRIIYRREKRNMKSNLKNAEKFMSTMKHYSI